MHGSKQVLLALPPRASGVAGILVAMAETTALEMIRPIPGTIMS
jgi:hypothetical protein